MLNHLQKCMNYTMMYIRKCNIGFEMNRFFNLFILNGIIRLVILDINIIYIHV